MKNKFIYAITGVAICVLVYGPMYYFFKKDAEKCDQIIFLEGEMSQDCRDVIYMMDGNIARITYCDGTRIQVPTSRINKIIDKQDVQ